MSRAILLTLGRLPKGLELARCLSDAGHTVYVADPFSSHLSKPSRAITKSIKVTAPNQDQGRFFKDILAIVERYGIDLIIPVSEEAVHVAQLSDQLPKGTTLFCAPPGLLMELHDKYSFIQTARKAGLEVPDTFQADDPAAQDLTAREDYVVKPALGCSGAGLRLANKGEPLLDAERTSRNIVQRRINGQEVSTFTIAHDGKVLGTAIYKGLIFAGTVATCFERLSDMPEIEAWIARFVAAQNYSGPIAFDFLIDETGLAFPIECNPRLTSGIHFFRHDDLAKAVFNEAPTVPLRFKPYKRLQEGHTSLTKAYSALPKLSAFFKRLSLVLTTRDVLWSWRDPGPFLLMTPMSWPVLSQVIFKGASFGEAATHDIEWRPDMPAGTTATETSSSGQERTKTQAASPHENAV